MVKDITALKEKCDAAVTSFRWGIHIPKGIETYRGKVIFYDYLRSLTDSEELTCEFRWYGDEVVINTNVSA
jgi:hypothetical protein